MIEKYVAINRFLRAIVKRCRDAIEAAAHSDEGYVEPFIADYIQQDVRDLLHIWPVDLENALVKQISQRMAQAGHVQDRFQVILSDLLPKVEDEVDKYFSTRSSGDLSSALIDLLHPVVIDSSYAQFRAGRLRDAVLNSIIAVFDLLRVRTGLDRDGVQLVDEALSIEHPRLIISPLDTESGKNEQKGFIQILRGAYQGVRNPKAHSLSSDLNVINAGQYLVFASLLARRIDEAHSNNDAQTPV